VRLLRLWGVEGFGDAVLLCDEVLELLFELTSVAGFEEPGSVVSGLVAEDAIPGLVQNLVRETSINGILCTLGENRCNVLNSLAA